MLPAIFISVGVQSPTEIKASGGWQRCADESYRTKSVDKNRHNPCKYWDCGGLIFFQTTLRVDKMC